MTVLQCGHGFVLNENGRCTGNFLKKDSSIPCALLFEIQSVSFLPSLRLPPQMKMSVPSSLLSAPLTALSASTPMAAISVVPREDVTRALSPAMMAQPVWVSGPGKVRVDLAGLPRSGEQRKHCNSTRSLKLP